MTFHPFGISHWIALIVVIATAFFVVRKQLLSAKTLALTIFTFHLPYQIIALLPANFNIAHSIPLHLCDLAWMVCAISLWSHSHWGSRLTYYWGLTLTPQALLTPALAYDFPHLIFFGFWINHGLVFMGTMYLVFVKRFRPNYNDFFKAFGFTVLWGIFVLTFNVIFSTNYMFLRFKPERSILDFLGPWPVYIFAEVFLIGVIWYYLTPQISTP